MLEATCVLPSICACAVPLTLSSRRKSRKVWLLPTCLHLIHGNMLEADPKGAALVGSLPAPQRAVRTIHRQRQRFNAAEVLHVVVQRAVHNAAATSKNNKSDCGSRHKT